MNNKFLIAGLVIVAIGLVGFMVSGLSPSGESEREDGSPKALATIYKSPTCGCCGVYGSYMERQGYGVQIENVEDMSEIKEGYGIPYDLESCHTMKIEGYIIEGHVPEEAVAKLLSEKPEIKGIGMAGMPSGSPGMPGPKNAEFVIYEILSGGQVGDVFMKI